MKIPVRVQNGTPRPKPQARTDMCVQSCDRPGNVAINTVAYYMRMPGFPTARPFHRKNGTLEADEDCL